GAADRAVSVSDRCRDRSSAGRRSAPSARPEQLPRRVPEQVRDPRGSRERRGGNDVPRISAHAANDAEARQMKTAATRLTSACWLAWRALPRTAKGQRAPANEVHTLHVQGSVYMLVTTGVTGGNVTVQVGDDGVLLVDTSVPQVTKPLMEEIRKLSNKPIRYIINTHVHADHVGGNEVIAKMGSTI